MTHYALVSTYQTELFALLVQIKKSSQKNVEASEATMFKLEEQETQTRRKEQLQKEGRVKGKKEPLWAVSFR